jgi:hypothetical protein
MGYGVLKGRRSQSAGPAQRIARVCLGTAKALHAKGFPANRA